MQVLLASCWSPLRLQPSPGTNDLPWPVSSRRAYLESSGSNRLIPDPMDEASDYTVHTIGSGISWSQGFGWCFDLTETIKTIVCLDQRPGISDQSLCYAGGPFSLQPYRTIHSWISTYVIVFSLTVNNDWSQVHPSSDRTPLRDLPPVWLNRPGISSKLSVYPCY